jgi:hypothetical protein
MNRAIVAVGAALGDRAPTLATIGAATVVPTITIAIAFTTFTFVAYRLHADRDAFVGSKLALVCSRDGTQRKDQESSAPRAPSEGELFQTVEDPGFFAAL